LNLARVFLLANDVEPSPRIVAKVVENRLSRYTGVTARLSARARTLRYRGSEGIINPSAAPDGAQGRIEPTARATRVVARRSTSRRRACSTGRKAPAMTPAPTLEGAGMWLDSLPDRIHQVDPRCDDLRAIGGRVAAIDAPSRKVDHGGRTVDAARPRAEVSPSYAIWLLMRFPSGLLSRTSTS
jgi:hypothetical protein